MKVYLAQMKWCEREEPILVGCNKKRIKKEALKTLKQKYGTGPVDRGQAMCSVKITANDIEVIEIHCDSGFRTK